MATETARMSSRPDLADLKLAQFYLRIQQPNLTLQTLNEAVRSAPAEALAATGGSSLRFNVAQGRAAAWRALGDLNQAISFQEEAVKLAPDSADAWSHLATLYSGKDASKMQYRGRRARARRISRRTPLN